MSEAYTLLEHESGGIRQTALLSENRLLEYTQEEAAGESLVGTLFGPGGAGAAPDQGRVCEAGAGPERLSAHSGAGELPSGQRPRAPSDGGRRAGAGQKRPQGREGRVPDPGRDLAGPVRAADAHESSRGGQQAHRGRRRPCSRPGTGQKAVRGPGGRDRPPCGTVRPGKRDPGGNGRNGSRVESADGGRILPQSAGASAKARFAPESSLSGLFRPT